MLKVVFMGTPDFAVPTLQALIDSPHEVVAVYSQPPRPAGRGQKDTKSLVHELAEANHIPVHTPISLKKPEIQEAFRAHKADVAVVAAYGLLLPTPILEAYPMGCLNLHPSLLPRWRGAAPIQRTLMAGDTKSALCIMQMNEGLDTGDVILGEEFDIPRNWDAGILHDFCATEGAKLMLEALRQLETGEAKALPQATVGVTYEHKITKDECRIDWSQSATEIRNHIRGLSPYPGAVCQLDGQTMKILAAEAKAVQHEHLPGTVMDDQMTIACGEGVLEPWTVQRAGKKPMDIDDMLRGYPIKPGARLS